MDNLLRTDLTAYYGAPACTLMDLREDCSDADFEVEDILKRLHVSTVAGFGTAVFNNPNRHTVTIIDYDRFLTSLPQTVQHGRQRCDMIAYTNPANNHFILGELKDRNYHITLRDKVKDQLLDTISCISAVPVIQAFIDTFQDKRCCYFNKKADNPPVSHPNSTLVTPTTSFNLVNTIAPNGMKLANTDINAAGYDYWEYFSGQKIEI